MSTANDPFNFDDLYKQAGVDNLFIKKSMAEQKAMAPRPGAATPTRPAVPNGVGPYSTSAAGHAGTPQAVQQGSPVKYLASGSPAFGSSNSLKGLDLDPFAGLGGLGRPSPMAASKSSPPVPTSARPRTPAQSELANSSSQPAAARPARSASPAAAPASAHTFDLADMFGPTANGSPQPQQMLRSTVAAAPEAAGSPADNPFDPFAAFDSVEGAAAAVPATPPVPVRAPSPAPPAAEPPAEPTQPSRAATPVQQQQPAGSNSPSAAPAAREAAKPSLVYFAELDQQQQQRQPRQHSRMDPDGRHASTTSSRYSAHAEHPSSLSSIGAAQHRLGPAATGSHVDGYGSPTSSSCDFGQAGYHEQAGGGGKGWGGLFKSVTKTAAVIGKKGLKAAQAGLAQLESAIENLDRPASSSGRPYSGSGGGAESDVDVPAERVLSIAIHISELPSTRQEEALARLPRPVRQKVLALLREQAVVEGQEQLQQPAAAAAGDADDVIHTREFDLGDVQEPAAAAAAAASARAERSSAPAGRDPPAAAVPAAAVASAAAASSPVRVVEDDLLGMTSPVAAAAATPPAAARVASVCDIDDFFSGGAPAAAAAAPPSANAAKPGQAAAVPRPRSAGPARSNGSSGLSRVSGSDGRLADLLGGASSSAAAGASKGSSMIHLGGLEALDVDVGSHGALYDDGDEAADSTEPEIRRQLRAARAAEKHAKMKAALAEKQAKEAAETERRQQQQAHKQAHKERIETWKNKNKGNVRGLLGSLQTVLWEDSGWKPIGMGDLLEPTQVRKAWMKANLLVHPDKVRQRNGSDEQVAIADMIFDALKEAWGQFRV